MNNVYLPTLTLEGWTNNPPKILDKVVTYYFLTDYEQSIYFRNNTMSISEAYYLYINDPENFSYKIKQDLTTLLKNYFTDVEINTRVIKKDPETIDYAVSVSAKVISDEGVYELYRLAVMKQTSLYKMLQYNNYGDMYTTTLMLV
jgi:hypothetical protein